MSAVTVQVGNETHAVQLQSSLGWVEGWYPGNALPDVWACTRPLASSFALIVEISNASADVGHKARGVIDGVQVIVTPPAGYELIDPYAIPWPTLWPIQRGTFRVYGIVPVGVSQAERRRVNEYVLGKTLSTWPDAAQTFGPAMMPLPTLSATQAQGMATRDMADFWALLDAVQHDKLYHMEDWEDGKVLPAFRGGWPIYGPADRAAPGGDSIQFSRGYQRNEGFARRSILCGMLCENGSWIQYRRTTGAPFSVDDYTGLSPDYKPGTAASNGRLPEFTGVPNDDPMPVEFDPAHQIRECGFWIAAFEMTGWPIFKRLIVGQGEEQRLIYSERTTVSMGGGYFSQNLATWEAWYAGAAGRIGKGYPGTIFGRQIGWSMWVAAEAYKIDGASSARVGLHGWLQRMCAVLDKAAMPSGICQRMHDFNSPPLWNDPTHDAAQSFEVAILDYGWRAAALQTGTPTSANIVKSILALYDAAPKDGPFHFIYVADAGGACYSGPLTLGKSADPNVSPYDPTHTEALCALGYAITHDTHFLDLSARFGLNATQAPTWRAKQAILETNLDLGWTANLLAQMQRA